MIELCMKVPRAAGMAEGEGKPSGGFRGVGRRPGGHCDGEERGGERVR